MEQVNLSMSFRGTYRKYQFDGFAINVLTSTVFRSNVINTIDLWKSDNIINLVN